MVKITPNDGGSGGIFRPTSITLDDTVAGASAEFTYEPISSGPKTIGVTNDQGALLKDPPSIAFDAVPVVLGIAGLRGWWKADAITGVADGAILYSWPDSSGNGFTLPNALGQPVFHLNKINGLPAVGFGDPGMGGGVMESNSAPILAANATGYAVFVVFQTPVVDPTLHCVVGIGLSGSAVMLRRNGPDLEHYHMDGTGANYAIVTKAGAFAAGAWRITSAVWDGNNMKALLGGIFAGAKAAVGIGSTGTRMTIGDEAYVGNYWDGPVAEVIVYQAPLTGNDRNKVEKYLGQKYALPVADVPAGVAGLQVWHRADSLGLTDGAPVPTWPDVSGHGFTATPTAATPVPPIFKVVNGLPAVRFTGTNDHLTSGFMLVDWSSPCTVFVVGAINQPPANLAGNSGFLAVGYNAQGVTIIARFDPSANKGTTWGTYAYFGGYLPANEDLVVGAVNVFSGHSGGYQSMVGRVFRNGVRKADVTDGTGGYDELANIYYNYGPQLWIGYVCACDVYEVLVYTGVLSDADRQAIENYLLKKYNVVATRLREVLDVVEQRPTL